MSQSPRALSVDDIIRYVCTAFEVGFEDIAGKGRRPQVVLARRFISRLAKRLTHHSYPEIARRMGRPTHSTIIYACRTLDQQMAEPKETQLRLNLGGELRPISEVFERIENDLRSRYTPTAMK